VNEDLGFQITGIDEACAMLERAPKAIIQYAYPKAFAAAAVPLYSELNYRTPVEHGYLKAALVTDIAVNGDKGGVMQIGYGKLGFIARMLEFGHRMFSHYESKTLISKPGKRKKYLRVGGHVDLDKPVPPDPFMREAFAASSEEATQAFIDSIAETCAGGLPEVTMTRAA
jgi:HK97 gp10 family phage protein